MIRYYSQKGSLLNDAQVFRILENGNYVIKVTDKDVLRISLRETRHFEGYVPSDALSLTEGWPR